MIIVKYLCKAIEQFSLHRLHVLFPCIKARLNVVARSFGKIILDERNVVLYLLTDMSNFPRIEEVADVRETVLPDRVDDGGSVVFLDLEGDLHAILWL